MGYLKHMKKLQHSNYFYLNLFPFFVFLSQKYQPEIFKPILMFLQTNTFRHTNSLIANFLAAIKQNIN